MTAQPVIVIGTVFVDVKCFPENELNFKGRNLGRASFYHGGVGRNVAESMALLGSPVRFCSSVQRGGLGVEVLDRLRNSKVDVAGVNLTVEPDGHGMWVAILHRDGDLACSISQMPDVIHMHRAWQRHKNHLLHGAGWMVLELDLSVALAEEARNDALAAGIPIIGLPGNFDCIRKQPSLLQGLKTFVCNQFEAEELYGKPVTTIPAAMNAARAIQAKGPEQVVVTLGALGAVGLDRGGEPFHVPAMAVDVVDTTGAGDSFVAGISHALSCGADLQLAVEAAVRVAGWTVSVSDSVCSDLGRRVRHDTWAGWAKLKGE